MLNCVKDLARVEYELVPEIEERAHTLIKDTINSHQDFFQKNSGTIPRLSELAQAFETKMSENEERIACEKNEIEDLKREIKLVDN